MATPAETTRTERSASLGSVVLNVGDISRAREFWTRALGYASRADNPAILRPVDGPGPQLALDEDDRTHLDLYVPDADAQRAEVERLLELGARRVEWAYPQDADFIVLADTEDNLFCVVNTSHG